MKKHLIAGLLLATVLLAACGSDDGDSEETEAAGEATEETQADSGASGDVTVESADSDLGEILVDGEGLTLYAFTEDSEGTSTCEDACLDAWPALTVPDDTLPEGLDSATFSVIERSDGTFQLAAAGQPLYYFSGDSAPGDTNGQNSGGTWFVVGPDGSLITDDSAAAEDTGSGGYDY